MQHIGEMWRFKGNGMEKRCIQNSHRRDMEILKRHW